ncbi:hypothetical protein CLIB1423_12S01882 [[Candida] railenensis]|uniref:Uncharacterized protein n=1 Tax=[Candida] railenensis TaxID=45579 RepID=A0A9P0VZM3_9ASCO|nr:hypothetical protein CLIB1423_12S01882 [[Candida] railenensis]
MYSPNLFSGDFNHLWLQNDTHNASNARFRSQPNSSPLIEDQRGHHQHLRHLFAPPLSAYSVENPGPNVTQLDYIIRTKSLNGNAIPSNNLLTPLVVKKLNKLQSISKVGYHSIAPVGINKTMGELEFEERRRAAYYEQQQQQQNSHSQSQSQSHINQDTLGQDDSNIPTVGNTSNSILEQPEDIDLDADVPDIDFHSREEGEEDGEEEDGEEGEGEQRESGQGAGAMTGPNQAGADIDNEGVINENEIYDDVDEDEGFMAEEVEYQDDHSISTADMSRGRITSVSTNTILNAIRGNDRVGSGSAVSAMEENAENDRENENETEYNHSNLDDESMDMD